MDYRQQRIIKTGYELSKEEIAKLSPEEQNARKKEMLEDIAVITGGQVISEEKGMKLEAVKLEMLGHARRVVATKEKTTIVGGKGKKADIDKRIAQLKNQIAISTSGFDKEKLSYRRICT